METQQRDASGDLLPSPGIAPHHSGIATLRKLWRRWLARLQLSCLFYGGAPPEPVAEPTQRNVMMPAEEPRSAPPHLATSWCAAQGVVDGPAPEQEQWLQLIGFTQRERQRLLFLRWLYRQGRLTDFPPSDGAPKEAGDLRGGATRTGPL